MSNGATFAQLLAAARPDVVAALVAHSGSQPANPAAAGNAQPILLIVGADDAAVNAMRADAAAFQKDGRIAELIVVPGLGHSWSARHNRQMWQFLTRHTNQEN
jgi:predicted esterase